MTRDEAKAFIQSLVTLRETVGDKEASGAVSLYPGLHNNGALIKAGTRINWNGKLKRAAVDLYDNEQSTPDAAPTLWEDISYREGERIIPETITPGLAFAKGEKGWWEDTLYESLTEGNVWTPKAHPQGWAKAKAPVS